MKSRVSKLLPLLLIALFLGGCGQKGPLYVPGTKDDPSYVPPVKAASDDAKEESEDEGQQEDENKE